MPVVFILYCIFLDELCSGPPEIVRLLLTRVKEMEVECGCRRFLLPYDLHQIIILKTFILPMLT